VRSCSREESGLTRMNHEDTKGAKEGGKGGAASEQTSHEKREQAQEAKPVKHGLARIARQKQGLTQRRKGAEEKGRLLDHALNLCASAPWRETS
jgi:hypothetical protein